MEAPKLGVEYPATTRRPKAREGMVIHELVDTSRYATSPAQARYIAAKSNAERQAALVDMPEATVTFYERPMGGELFDLS